LHSSWTLPRIHVRWQGQLEHGSAEGH
jgi:hypothetical protein